jgi:ribose transport system permease protein
LKDKLRLANLHAGDIGALYVLIGLIVAFSLSEPGTFPHTATITAVLSDNVVTGLLGLALVVPLAAGEFDISVAYVLGASSILLAWCLGPGGLALPWAILITAVVCLTIGIFNAVLIVGIGLNSFVATLATGSLLAALIQALSGGYEMTAGVQYVEPFANAKIGPITAPVACMFVLAAIMWIVMQHTALGRHLYATGFGAEASRLAGVATSRLRATSLIASAMIAGFAGIVITAQVGAADPSAGPPYLIPAFAAAFLGSTQLWPGYFNAWGTVLTVVLLGTLQEGLALGGAPSWVQNVCSGSVLIVALAIASFRDRDGQAGQLLRRFMLRRRQEHSGESAINSGATAPRPLGRDERELDHEGVGQPGAVRGDS